MPRNGTPPKRSVVPPEQLTLLAAAASAAGKRGAAPHKRAEASPPKQQVVAPKVAAAASPVLQGQARRTAHIAPAGALPPAHIPPEAMLTPRHDKLLAATIGISLLVHVVVMMVHFKPFDLKSQKDKGPSLEVALVNAKTIAKPTKADILAQANLDGGGNTDANRRAKTPLPVLPKNLPDQQVSVVAQRVEALGQRARELITQMQTGPALAAAPPPINAVEKTELPSANELMQRTLEAIRLEAQIAKDMEQYQKRPKRRFIGARAEEYRFARYVEDWRMKIERIGNLNYPEAARQQKLYGSLLLTVSINGDGSVENIEINRTSGSRVLDAAAVKIVEMSGPFAPFPPDIKRDTDILHITRTWTFTKADALEFQ